MTEEERQRLIEFLEADQLVSDTSRPLPRAKLTRRGDLGLWALRIFAALMGVLVIYTFIAQLH
ncbi:MAG TPA: hypothetical protein VG321_11275 [Solirubrobacteraceae bacterium]|jgi:hypothetical protein|nr:hypothetical protein [Solirubrobacteraceae bacterium]